jgi:subtilisin family serine protease
MKCSWFVILVVTGLIVVPTSRAQQRGLIVRDTLGITDLNFLCPLLGCQVVEKLGDPLNQLFLVTPTVLGTLDGLLEILPLHLGIVSVEVDQLVNLIAAPPLTFIPNELANSFPTDYYGTVVTQGYLDQPASSIVRITETHNTFDVSGSGIVAIIDTGVDPLHPALAPVLLPGYDFVHNTNGADEKGDLDHSTVAVLDGGGGNPAYVNPWTAAVVSQLGAAALNTSQYAAFGHGTMVAGIVHLVAPTAKILPLKAFSADGTGSASNIIRALYFATAQGSKVASMSFSFSSSSSAMSDAINYANSHGVICVAAAGNEGAQIKVYPASYAQVMGVASTSNSDTLSSFSDYGPQVVWVGAPGENIVSTYPFATYASSSGTSFSTPFVSGTAALLANLDAGVNQSSAATAIGHATHISPQLNRGLLDTYEAVESVELTSGRNRPGVKRDE